MPFTMRAPSFGIKESASDINETLFLLLIQLSTDPLYLSLSPKEKGLTFSPPKNCSLQHQIFRFRKTARKYFGSEHCLSATAQLTY